MPIFPGGYGADATVLDEDDKAVWSVDGAIAPVPGALIRDFVGRGYTRVIDMVRDVGCDPTGVADDRAKIQAVVDTYSGTSGGTTLYFPNGVYKVDGAIDLFKTIDWDAKLHIRGQGRRGVEIRQLNPAEPVFDMRNSTQNLRGIVISDMTLRYGAQQLYLSRAAYNLFQNLTFLLGGEGSTKSHVLEQGSHMNFFDNCWWVHQDPTGDVGGLSSGTAFYTNCIFGEDTGNFYCGGTASFVNCRFQYGEDRNLTTGYQSMGKAMITIPTDGIMKMVNCQALVTTNFINMDNASRVIIVGNEITMGTGPVLKVRNTDSGYPLIFANNNVTWQGNGLFYASTLGEHLQNSVFSGNAFEVAPTFNATVDDGLLDPRYRNVWRDNTYRSGLIF